MRSWWKVSKCSWANRRQTYLTQTYKNLFPDMTSASILAVTTLRSSFSIYIFFVYNKIFFHIACFVNSSPEVTFQIVLVFFLFDIYIYLQGFLVYTYTSVNAGMCSTCVLLSILVYCGWTEWFRLWDDEGGGRARIWESSTFVSV
jgi:hypothetical protein